MKLLNLVAAILLIPHICFAAGPLSVEATVKDVPDIGRPVFTVITKIKNLTNSIQSVKIWTGCYGWSWLANRVEIVTGVDSCMQNFPAKVELKPHEERIQEIQIEVESEPKVETLTFHLGFTPNADWIGTRIGIIPQDQLPSSVIWSNDIKVTISPEMLSKLAPPSNELIEKSKHLYCSSYPCKEKENR